MDIKKRIQELSLDQKAKLYFMGLVRQGKIDTLPEDPKAAYINMMMDKDDYGRSISGKDKRTFMEPEDSMPAARAKKMAGMEENKKPNLKSIDDVDNSNWSPDRGGGSIGYMEWEDGTEMTPQEIQDYFEVNHELYDDIMQGLYETNDPEDDEEQAEYDKGWYGESLKEAASKLGYLNENQPTVFDDESMDELLDIILKYVKDPDDAYDELDRFEDGGFDALSNMVAANLDRDPEYKAWYNKLHSIQEPEDLSLEPEEEDSYRDMIQGKYSDDDLKLEPELDENINESKVDISYTDPGFRFYKMKVDGKRLDREEGTKYLKDLGIDMEIPRSYDESILDKIVAQLKEKGIDADHDAAMDVS